MDSKIDGLKADVFELDQQTAELLKDSYHSQSPFLAAARTRLHAAAGALQSHLDWCKQNPLPASGPQSEVQPEKLATKK